MLSPEVERILEQAVAEGRRRNQPLVTLEHVVHAMTGDPGGAELLSACGAQVGKLRTKLTRRLDHLPNFFPLPATAGENLAQAVELQRALKRAEFHAHAAGRAQITLAGFLAALVREETAYAVSSLKRQRVTLLSVTTHDTHGTRLATETPKLPRARLLGRWRPAPRDPADRYEVVFHNDDYTPREFVIELLTTLFARSREVAEALMWGRSTSTGPAAPGAIRSTRHSGWSSEPPGRPGAPSFRCGCRSPARPECAPAALRSGRAPRRASGRSR